MEEERRGRVESGESGEGGREGGREVERDTLIQTCLLIPSKLSHECDSELIPPVHTCTCD